LGNRIADLTVRLDADSARFKREVQDARQLLRGYGRDAKAANSSNNQFSSGFSRNGAKVVQMSGRLVAGFGAMATGIGAVVAVGGAVVATVNAIAGAQAQLAREWETMSQRSRTTVADIQSFSYATKEYNINADKSADILKDFNDKLGDFLATGGGEFKDFFENIAPQVGLTAQELAKMSGPDALIAVKKAMDDTNTSAQEQVFYLESIADEASVLIPLLANGGEKLKAMDERFKGLNSTLTQSEITKLKSYQQDVDDLSQAWDAWTREAVMPWVDELGEGARYLAEIFSEDRKETLKESIADTKDEISELKNEIIEYQDKVDNGPKYGGVTLWEALVGDTDNSKILAEKKEELAGLETDLSEFQQRWDELHGKVKTDDNKAPTVSALAGGDDRKKLEQVQAAGAAKLAALNLQYANEAEQLQIDHQQRLTDIEALNVSEQELARLGFENLAALRQEYKDQEMEFYLQQESERLLRIEEQNNREVEAERRKQERIKAESDRVSKQKHSTEARLDKQMLSMKYQVGSEMLGIIESNAKEGSALQKTAFLAQKVLSAKQIYMQGEVAAMSALALPPIGLGPVAGQGMAAQIRLMAGLSMAGVLSQAIAGFRELGGGVSSGKPYIVGERGPEIFVPGAGGQITSNSNLKRLGGGNVVVNLYEAPPGTRVNQRSENGQDVIDVFISDLEGDGEISQSMQSKFALQRQGR